MQVDFYLLTTSDRESTWKFAARLIEKIYRLKHRIQIQLTPAELELFNQHLWSYRAESFLPHDIANADNANLPVLLHTQDTLLPNHEILVNFSEQIIENPPQTLKRIVEIVSQNEQDLTQSRQRYRAYQTKGFKLKIHHV